MTYGDIRLRLTKLFPGVDLEIIDGFLQDGYTEILDKLAWKRSEATSVIQAPASYITGTLAATQGSANIVGTGTTWSPSMDGFMIRIDNKSEFYQFTDVNATNATLDRPYEGPTDLLATYRIDQSIFLLPANARILRQVRPMQYRTPGGNELEMVTPAELNRIAGDRNNYGNPRYAAHTWDNFADPPQLQVELFPIPSLSNGADPPDATASQLSFEIDYIFDQADIDPSQTSVSLLPWVRPAALIAYVSGKLSLPRPGYDGNLSGYEAYLGGPNSEYNRALNILMQTNALQRGPQAIRLARNLQRQTPPRYKTGPWHRGFTG